MPRSAGDVGPCHGTRDGGEEVAGASPPRLCVGQPEQQTVFQFVEGDGVLGQLANEACRLLLQVGALVLHHQAQQLVLQALHIQGAGEAAGVTHGRAAAGRSCTGQRQAGTLPAINSQSRRARRRAFSVTQKLTNVHCAAISGL